MQTYVVAGGAGFIGSHVCEELLKEGNRVICVDSLLTGVEENVSKFYDNSNFTFVNQDVITGVPQVTDEIKGIFHLASPASPNIKSAKSYINHPIATLLVNSVGTKNLLDMSIAAHCPLLFASSSEVYGDPNVSPQTEDYFGNVNPNGIRSVYDEGKRFGEAMCMAYARNYEADVRIIRIFNTYGDRMQKDDGRVVSNFINQALNNEAITVYGEGSQTRSFCYVDDLVGGLIKAIQTSEAKNQVMNLGNPDEHTITDLANMIKDLTGSDSEIIHEDLPEDDPRKRKPDISKATKILGFEPKIKIEEGLKRTIEYFKAQS